MWVAAGDGGVHSTVIYDGGRSHRIRIGHADGDSSSTIAAPRSSKPMRR